MADAISINEQLARWVVEELNAANSTFSESFAAKYDPLPKPELKDLATLLVTVNDASETMLGFASRSQTDHEYAVAVNAWQKVSGPAVQQVAKLKHLAQQFRNFFRFKVRDRVDGYNRLKRIDGLQVWSDTSADELGCMKITMTLVFRGWE